MPVNRKHAGGSFDDFLKEDGIYEEVMQIAAKNRLAIQFQKEMKKKKITKSKLAKLLSTSRAQVDRILSPENNAVSVASLSRAAEAIGCRLKLELESA